VLITDGRLSFVMFNYGNLSWVTSGYDDYGYYGEYGGVEVAPIFEESWGRPQAQQLPGGTPAVVSI